MKDNHTHLGTLKTLTIQDFESQEFDVGTFELEVDLSTPQLMASADKPGLIRSTIAQHLAHAINFTGVPSHLWYFETAPRVVKEIPSFPTTLVFGQ